VSDRAAAGVHQRSERVSTRHDIPMLSITDTALAVTKRGSVQTKELPVVR
jgi:hypothetical protein